MGAAAASHSVEQAAGSSALGTISSIVSSMRRSMLVSGMWRGEGGGGRGGGRQVVCRIRE
jgi:hypothetical protein